MLHPYCRQKARYRNQSSGDGKSWRASSPSPSPRERGWKNIPPLPAAGMPVRGCYPKYRLFNFPDTTIIPWHRRRGSATVFCGISTGPVVWNAYQHGMQMNSGIHFSPLFASRQSSGIQPASLPQQIAMFHFAWPRKLNPQRALFN